MKKILLVLVFSFGLLGCYSVQKLNNPSWYQGGKRADNYFEGWYLKHVSADNRRAYSVIVGASYPDKRSEASAHSFVQIIDGSTAKTHYFRYPISDFSHTNKSGFGASVGKNTIGLGGLNVDVSDGLDTIRGRLLYRNVFVYDQTFGIMSWLRLLPKMQCYHGLVSLNHEIVSGSLVINGDSVDFSGGKGYIEKDWGSSMPSSWVWLQCNSFVADSTASLVVSLANVPYLGVYRRGYFAVLSHGGKVYRFAAYDVFSSIRSFEAGKSGLQLVFRNRAGELTVDASRTKTGVLKAPVGGRMSRDIEESLDARVRFSFRDRRGVLLVSGVGTNAGFEMVGNLEAELGATLVLD